ncbi:MAG TPA: roadblock/LC7 domain-containing protein [Candidatus Xenobia bacterium]|jgi:hypothetical protein
MSEELQKTLENFCRLEGVQCVLLLAPDGTLAGSHAEKGEHDLAQVQALASRCLGLGQRMGSRMDRGSVNHSHAEFSDYSILAEVLDSKAALVIVTEPETNLGRLRLEIRKNRKAVDGLLPA